MVDTYKQFLIVLISLLMLTSCSQTTKEYVLKVKLNKLTDEDIYNYSLIKDVIFDAEELNIDSVKGKSREAFLKGVDEYKNKRNPAVAITFFKKSILIFPDAKAYYELGNALMEFRTNKEYLEEADQAYRVAEELEIKPIYAVYYKQACIANMLGAFSEDNGYEDNVIYHLRESFKAGFYDTLSIEKDARINSIVTTSAYKSLLRELRSENSSKDKNALFELYKAAYPRQTSGFEIPISDASSDNNKESISYDFSVFVPEMQNTEFSRDVSNDFFYEAIVRETPAYTALVYTSVSFWGENEDGLMPAFTSLVTYDPAGIIIDRKLIACQCSSEKIKTVKITDNKVYVEDYKRIWKKPIDKVSFDENEIEKYEPLAKLTYLINDDGTITATEIPADYIDTIITKDQSKNPPQ
jgi:tetratricopeptide (TPR) repeat protein